MSYDMWKKIIFKIELKVYSKNFATKNLNWCVGEGWVGWVGL